MMIIISSREFREKQRFYLDKVDTGEQIVIQRGKDRSYKLVPVSKDDTLMAEDEFYEKINRSIQQELKGETERISYTDELKKMLGL